MNEKYVLAIDLGTSGPKVSLFSAGGSLVGSTFEETALYLLPGGGAEQAPDEWWRAVDRAVTRLLVQDLVPRENIAAVVPTGQWSGTVAVDESGEVLMNALIWMDARGASEIPAVVDGLLKIEGFAVTKLFQWIRLTGGIPAHAGKDSIAHILYLKKHRPEIYRAAYKFLEPVDYLGLRLTGRFAASHNSIMLHWVTDTRDINNIHYHEGLIKAAGVDPDKLPELVPTNSVLGPLLPALARAWGLRDSVQVVAGAPDVLSTAVGSGAVQDFETHLYIGTSSWLTCHVPYKKTDLFNNMASLPSAIPGRYLLGNEQESAGACLQYVRDQIFFHQDELNTGGSQPPAYSVFDRIAARAPAGSGGVLFLPWLNGERTPVDDHTVRGGFFNLSLHSTREHLVRAVFEGVAFNSRWLLKYVERFIRRETGVINMVGGGARSDIWCQIHADVLGRQVRQMEDPGQASARGAALLASAALGFLSYDELGTHAPVRRTYSPDPAHRALYDDLFQAFVEVYRQNRRLFARLNKR